MTVITSVSLPDEVRAALDVEAARQRRSRSFVVAEALRHYLPRSQAQAFDEARERTLCEGLALKPEERVLLAEELWRDLVRGRETVEPWYVTFRTFGEHDEWQRAGAVAATRVAEAPRPRRP